MSTDTELPIASVSFHADIVRETASSSDVVARQVYCTMDLYRDGDEGRIDWDWHQDFERIGLIFEGNKVVDFDGVFDLPREARMLLIGQGYDLSEILIDQEGNDLP